MTRSPDIARQLTTLVRLIEGERFPLTTEKALQSALALTLTGAGLSFVREHRFCAGDIVDLWCPPIAIETKSLGAKRALTRLGEARTEGITAPVASAEPRGRA